MHQTITLSEIFLAVLDLLPTATSRSPRVAKSALCEEPDERPSLKDNYVGLALNYLTIACLLINLALCLLDVSVN